MRTNIVSQAHGKVQPQRILDRPYTKAESQAQFRTWSRKYDGSILQKILFIPSHNQLLENLNIGNKPFRLLDIGCGTGVFVERVTQEYPRAEVWGVDLSSEMISYGPERTSDVQFVLADSECLPIASNSFDFVTCSNSFHHYPNQANAVSEMHRVLKPGGKLMIIDGYRDKTWGWLIYDVCVETIEGAVHHASAKEFRELFTNAGFVDLRQQVNSGLAPFLLTTGTAAKSLEL